MKKTIVFNVQEKGGAGKSFFTYLQGLKYEKADNVLFCDADNGVQSSFKNLAFLKNRRTLINFENPKTHSIEREKVYTVLENICKNNEQTKDYNHIIIDFGAPESEQLPKLFQFDYNIDDFVSFGESLSATFKFNIIMSGGLAYESCLKYATTLGKAVQSKIHCTLWINEFSFSGNDNQYEQIEAIFKDLKAKKYFNELKKFGNIYPDRPSGITILENIRNGVGNDGYKNFLETLAIKKELEKI